MNFTDNWFTYITGLATLISLALQLIPIFPRYQGLTSKLLFVLAGAFVGSLVGGIKFEGVTFQLEMSPLKLLVLVVQLVMVSLGVYFLVRTVHKKPNDGVEAEGASAACFFIFFVLFLYHVFSSGPDIKTVDEKISLQEWNMLANEAEQKAQFDRAIWLYRQVRVRLSDPSLRESIDHKIKDLTARSAGLGN